MTYCYSIAIPIPIHSTYLHGTTGWLWCFLQWTASLCLIFKDLLSDWSVLGHEFGWMVAASFSTLVMSIWHWPSNFILIFISRRSAFSAWGSENWQSVTEPVNSLIFLCWYSLWRWRARRHMLWMISCSKSSSISASNSSRICSSSVETVLSDMAPCCKINGDIVDGMSFQPCFCSFCYL